MVPCIGRGHRVAARGGAGLLARRALRLLGAAARRRPRSRRAGRAARPRAACRRPRPTTVCRSSGSSASAAVAGVRRRSGCRSRSRSRSCRRRTSSPVADVRRVGDDRAVERDHGRHAVDHELVERAPRALERLGAVAAGDDQLGDEGVERAGDGLALLVAAVEADAGAAGRVPGGRGCRGGHEVAAAVLGVDPELDRVAADLRVVVPELLAGGDAEHLADQVDAGDLLGDAVLDLEAGVDLEEGDGAVLGDQELAGAGADVAGLAQDRLRRLVEAVDLVVGEERRGRLLDQLLVAALQRAVAGGDDDDVAVLVGQALGLDVARLVEELLDEALAAAERRRPPRGPPTRRRRRPRSISRATLRPRPPPPNDRLDRDRQAVLLGERDDLVGVLDRVLGARGQRGADLLGDVPGLDLVAERLDRRRRRADPGQPGVDHGLGEVGVLGEEAVARVHGVGAGLLARPR